MQFYEIHKINLLLFENSVTKIQFRKYCVLLLVENR